MLIVHVHITVLTDDIDAFKEATIENAGHSIREPGIARFDFLGVEGEPTKFVLIEVYRDAEAAAAHKTTRHYAKWRDTVQPMMAEPRTNVKYYNLFPEDGGWL